MPYVNIKITREGNVTPEQKQALIEGATNLLHDVLGKNKKTTVVVIDEVDTIIGASEAFLLPRSGKETTKNTILTPLSK